MLVDTNVLLDVIQDDATWADWSISQLRSQAKVYQLVINPVIYAEISLAFERIETLDKVLEDMQLPMMELPKPALFLAAKAFLAYRRRGGLKRNVLSAQGISYQENDLEAVFSENISLVNKDKKLFYFCRKRR